jgi:thiol-disulfide isomerase/thioredoxin
MSKQLLIILILLTFQTSALASLPHYSSEIKGLIIHDHPINIPEEVYFFDKIGNKKKLESYEGKLVILHFWATWCTYCVNEMLELDGFKKHLRSKLVRVVPVSIDYKGLSLVEKFYMKQKIRLLEIFLDDKNQLFKSLQIIGLPTTIFIDPDGKEIARVKGVIDWKSDSIKKLVDNFSINAKSDEDE